MKLLPVIVAVAKAQIDLPDLSNFDLSAFGLGPGTPIDFPAAGDEERYFFTTSTTTRKGGYCWKCDAMSFGQCAADGSYTFCHSGDDDCCFVEIREKDQKLHQLCTGCKAREACKDNQLQNFNGPFTNHQCRPDYRQQIVGRSRGRQSVCRQCFETCDITQDKNRCFGAMVDSSTTENVKFTLFSAQATIAATRWNGFRKEADVDGFGIPTWGALDTLTDGTVISAIAGITAGTENLWFKNIADGKAHVSDADNTRGADDMIFWSILGADQAWWSDDLKPIQTGFANIGAGAIATSDFQ
jgi:hypothetical protein